MVEEAVALHRELAPGPLEFIYEVCLAEALEQRGCNPIYLLNFGKALMENRIERIVNGLEKKWLIRFLRTFHRTRIPAFGREFIALTPPAGGHAGAYLLLRPS